MWAAQDLARDGASSASSWGSSALPREQTKLQRSAKCLVLLLAPSDGYFFRSHRYSAHRQQSLSWAKPARPRGLMSPRHTAHPGAPQRGSAASHSHLHGPRTDPAHPTLHEERRRAWLAVRRDSVQEHFPGPRRDGHVGEGELALLALPCWGRRAGRTCWWERRDEPAAGGSVRPGAQRAATPSTAQPCQGTNAAGTGPGTPCCLEAAAAIEEKSPTEIPAESRPGTRPSMPTPRCSGSRGTRSAGHTGTAAAQHHCAHLGASKKKIPRSVTWVPNIGNRNKK